jgi:hypothetical protein
MGHHNWQLPVNKGELYSHAVQHHVTGLSRLTMIACRLEGGEDIDTVLQSAEPGVCGQLLVTFLRELRVSPAHCVRVLVALTPGRVCRNP